MCFTGEAPGLSDVTRWIIQPPCPDFLKDGEHRPLMIFPHFDRFVCKKLGAGRLIQGVAIGDGRHKRIATPLGVDQHGLGYSILHYIGVTPPKNQFCPGMTA